VRDFKYGPPSWALNMSTHEFNNSNNKSLGNGLDQSADRFVADVRITKFRSDKRPLSKSYQLIDGKLDKNAAGVLYAGQCKSLQITNGDDLRKELNNCSVKDALALGVPKLGCEGEKFLVVTKKNLESSSDNAITRSLEYFEWFNGSGLLFVDLDNQGIPDSINAKVKAATNLPTLLKNLFPGLKDAEMVWRASTSAGIYNTETGEQYPAGGEHLFIFATEAADVAEATKRLHQRLWLLGYGWMAISPNGALLERSVADRFVGSPERLVYEGAPNLAKPLAQDNSARDPKVMQGCAVDLFEAIPPLTDEELEAYEALVEKATKEIYPELERVRIEVAERDAPTLAERAQISIEEAKRQLMHRHTKVGEWHQLAPNILLIFDDPILGTVSVKEVLANLKKYHEKTLADPVDGHEYGRCKAELFDNGGGNILINSFAHGKKIYQLIDLNLWFPSDVEEPLGSTEKVAGAFNGGETTDAPDSAVEHYTPKRDLAIRDQSVFDPWETFVVPKFPAEVFPEPLQQFLSEVSCNMGADPSGVAWSALATISGALDHRFTLRLKKHGNFLVSPRLWVLLVGEPSTKKSPLMTHAIRDLRQHEATQMIVHEMFPNQEGQPPAPPPPRHIIQDATPEKTAEILAHQDRGTLLWRDEVVGWIGQMEKGSGGSKAGAYDRGFWLQAYNGGFFTADRVGRGTIRVNNLSISILGGVQPSRLKELHGLTSDGLLQRFIPVMLSDSGRDQDTSTEAADAAFRRLILDCVTARPMDLELSPEAMKEMAKLRDHLHDLEISSRGLANGFEGFIGKMAGVAGSLTLILHIIKSPRTINPIVNVETVKMVDHLIREFVLKHALEFYRSVGDKTEGDHMKQTASWILTSGLSLITTRDLQRNVTWLKGQGVDEIRKRISPMVAGGWLEEIPPGKWRVMPVVQQQLAVRRASEEDGKRRSHPS